MKKHLLTKLLKYLLASLVVFVITAQHLSAQPKGKTITLTKNNVSLKSVIDEIKKQTKMEFMYNDELINKYKVSVAYTNTPLLKAMDELFANLPLKYNVKDNIVVIAPDNTKKIGSQNEFLFKGKIMQKGEKVTVPGATIIVEGTTRGAIADMSGNFSLRVKVGESINVSFTGNKEATMTIHEGMNNIIIEMERDAMVVDNVIVTGYGKVKDHENVGASTKLTGKDLEKNAGQTLEQMLQGKVAGMLVTNTSGAVGTRQKVKVRGTSTLLGNQEPVWVVDGIIQEDPIPFKTMEFNSLGVVTENNMDLIRNFVGNAISWLNPNDIKDIVVLKDAAATAIYGVKAANGVIVINTKRGQAGSVSIGYSGGLSINSKTNYDKLNLMNSKERVDVSREIIENGYIRDQDLLDVGYDGLYKKYMDRTLSYDQFNAEVKKLEMTNTNWLDLLMRAAVSNNHSISLSGGSDKVQYYSSVSASFAKGEARRNDKEDFGASLNVTAVIIPEKLTFNTRLSGNMSSTEGPYGANAFDYATKTSRAFKAYNEDGSRYFYPDAGRSGGLLYNFMHESDNSSNTNKTNSLSGAISLNWTISQEFRFDTSLGYGLSNNRGESYLTEQTNAMTIKRGYEFGSKLPNSPQYKSSKLPHGGELNTTNTFNFNYTWRAQLSYNKLLGNNNHRISAMAGYEMRSNKYEGYDQTLYGYFPERGKTVALPPQQTYNISTQKYERNSLYDFFVNTVTDRISNYMSIYATAGYSYKEKYILSANVRSDASNKFGQDKRAAFMPVFSVGGRWNAAEERFMKNQRVFNNLSFRGSYGWQGNVAENFGPDLIARIIAAPDLLSGEYMIGISSLPYADLRWEKVKTYNLGVDFGLFQNKVMISANYYHKKTVDMIVNLEVPMEFGILSMPINGGTMSNSGWDLTVSMTPVRTDNFSWSFSLNTARNKNNIDSELEPRDDWRSAVKGNINKQGYAYSSIWGFEYLGLDAKGAPIHKLADPNAEGYNDRDATSWMKYMGKLEPDFSGGISTSLQYKQLTLSASFNLNIGAVRFIAPYVTNYTTVPRVFENMSKEFNDRWRKPGDENRAGVKPGLPNRNNVDHVDVSKDQSAYNYELYNHSNERLVNANFFRCNNISLGYNFPERFIRSLGIKALSVNAGMSNPFKIVSKDFKGLDPEVASGQSPLLKSYTVGLSISF